MFIIIFFSNYHRDDIRCFNFLLLSPAYCYLIKFFCLFVSLLINGSYRKFQNINFRVKNNAIALIDFTTQMFYIFFCSNGYVVIYKSISQL